MSVLTKLVGDPTAREVKQYRVLVDRVNSLEAEISALTDSELAAKTEEFRKKLGATAPDLTLGASIVPRWSSIEDSEEREQWRGEHEEYEAGQRELDEILPEAFAVVREAAKRTLGMRHFDVQLIGGMVLHAGKIAEMRTGEGKTLVATLALYLNALQWKGAHLVTANDYLAKRDAGWNGPLFHFLGMSVGVVITDSQSYMYDPEYLDDSPQDPRLKHLRPTTKREAYACDITYGTNNEFGFDYLRDNMALRLSVCAQRKLWFAIVDEVDSILIDEARTPLIISGQADEPTQKYYQYAQLVPRLEPEVDYTSDEKSRSVTLTDEGVAKIEEWTGIGNIFDLEHVVDAHQINQALIAHVHYKKDVKYIVVDGEVVIVDEFTGRTMHGRRWSDGLHQAIEAKEGLKVNQENKTLATITFQNFFRIYRKLAGMTGTALTEAEEFHKIYKLDVVPIPTNRPMIRDDAPDVIFRTEEAKFNAVVDEIEEAHKDSQPVLVGTTNIEKSERLSRLLEKRGIAHEVLNAKQHEKEANIVAGAGQAGAVTIATNMAGRGTDIVLGTGVTDVGGLYIIGTERHESRRIDNQLRGRAGRQGDPGETRFFLSFEDDVMRVFGGDRMQGLMERFHIDENVPIESKLVTRQIEGAQSRVEGTNFDLRRHVVEYDDVMNKQREIIYGERRKILEGTDTRSNLMDFVRQVLDNEVPTYCPSRHHDEWDLEGLWERVHQLAPIHAGEEVDLTSLGDEPEQVVETLVNEFEAHYQEREKKYGAEALRQAEQEIILQVIDVKWRDYLTQMEHLREGVGLAGYAQIDPLVEYKQQAYGAFQELIADIQHEAVRVLMQIEIQAVEPGAEPVPAATATEVAPRPGRADVGVSMSPAVPPPARPAAAAASAALNRVSQRTAVTNVVESSGAGEHASTVAGAPTPKKLGRNELCWCGSGKKYKKCHGA